MSLTSQAFIGLIVVIIILILRAKLREKDAEMAMMATAMGMQSKLTKEDGALVPDGEHQVTEWSFGDKKEDMHKPGVHVTTRVKIEFMGKPKEKD